MRTKYVSTLSMLLASSLVCAAAPQPPATEWPQPTAPRPGARLWTPVSWGGEPGSMQLYFVDKASIRREGALVELTTLAVNEVPTKGGADRVEERSRFLCNSRQSVAMEQRYLGRARQLHFLRPEPKREDFPEGSAWRIVIDSVCTDDLNAEPTDDPGLYAEAFFNA